MPFNICCLELNLPTCRLGLFQDPPLQRSSEYSTGLQEPSADGKLDNCCSYSSCLLVRQGDCLLLKAFNIDADRGIDAEERIRHAEVC